MDQVTVSADPMQSSDIGKLAEALAKAQAEMEGAKKDGKNPFFKSDYSTLFSVWQACREPLTKNGLSIIQTTGGNGTGIITVYTILAHSSGQWIKSALSIKPAKTDPQTLGSCLTYLRRYSLAGVVGLSPLDDDAEAAMAEPRKEKKPTKQPTKKSKEPEPLTREKFLERVATAKASINELTKTDEGYNQALKVYGIEKAEDMKDMKEGEELLKDLGKFYLAKKKEVDKTEQA